MLATAPTRLSRFLAPPRVTSPLAQAWMGTGVVSNGATSVTLDYSTAPTFEWVFAVILLSDAQDNVPRPPDGWGEVKQGREGATGAAGSSLIVWSHYRLPGDPPTQQFTWGTNCSVAAQPISWTGLDPVTPIEAIIYTAHTSGQAYATGTITPTRQDRRLVGIFGLRGTTSAGSFPAAPGLYRRTDVASSSNPWCVLSIGDTVGTVATATSYTATCTTTSSHGGSIGFALIPAGSANLVIGRPNVPARPGMLWQAPFRLRAVPGDTTSLPVAGGTTINGTATIVGAGVVADVAVTESAPASPAGAGTLTAAGSGAVFGTATIAGAGALSNTVTQLAPASPAGAGSVTNTVVERAPVTIAGAGAITANSAQQAAAGLAGAGTMSAFVTESVTLAAVGAGVLSASAGGNQAGVATMAGAGLLAAATVQSAPATLTGVGVLSAKAVTAVTVSPAGVGALTSGVVQRATVTIVGAGTLTAASAGGAIHGTASLVGAGVLVTNVNACTTLRPFTGNTARPGSGTTTYALATTARPGSGTTARPNTGTTQDPC